MDETMGALAASLNKLYADLKATKLTQKRAAFKSLVSVLDSGPYLEALDAATVRLAPGAPVPSLSWPGLAHVLTKHIREEVEAGAGLKKGPDAGLGRGFRLLVARAEEGGRRCGAGRLLLRRAPALFKHVAEVLDRVGLASPIGADYSHALRNQLLTVPEYCAAAVPYAFQELVGVHLDFLDKHRLERGGEEVQRALAALAALLAAYPGDVAPLLQTDILDCLRGLVERLLALAEEAPSVATRLLTPTLVATNTFLLAWGRDCAAGAAAVHASALHAAAMRGLTAKDPRLREAAMTYLRCQLQLGGLPPGSQLLGDLQGWVERELAAPGLRWGDDTREGRLQVGRQQATLLALAAATLFHASGAAQEPGSGGSGDDDFELPARAAKRRRAAPLLLGLGASLEARPAAYAPLLARLVLSYGLALPAEAYAEWLAALARMAPTHFPAHFMADEHDADAALWLLRLVHALALAWPLHLAPGPAGGGGGGGADGLPSQATVEEQWAAVWGAVLGYARSANVPAASFTAALPVLATVARRRLAGQLPPGFHRLWGLPLLDQLPTPAALDLAEAAALSGADAAVDAAAWQPGLLQWLRSAAPASAAGSLVAVVAAVLRLPPDIGGAGSGGGSGGGSSWGSGTSAEDAPSLSRLSADADCSWWQWWQEDAALSAQLAGLIRGELLMRARALALLQRQQEAEAAAAARLRPQQLAAVLAPAQLQEQAAEVLEERLEDVLRQVPSPGHASLSGHASRLAQLLACATAAVTVTTRAAAAAAAAGRPVPPCWLPEGCLAAKLQLALQQCGNQLAEACKRLEGILPAEEAGLRGLAAALHAYQAQLGSAELATSLTRCMGQVEELFLHAAQLMPEVVATQAVVATRGAAATAPVAAEWLDDDLDVGGRAPAVARAGSTAPTAAVTSSASLASAAKARCAALLSVVGPLVPVNGSQAAQYWLRQASQPGEAVLAEEAHFALIDTMVQCCIRSLPARPEDALRIGLAACATLASEHGGVLAWPPRHHNGRCLFALRRAGAVVAAVAAAGAADPEILPALAPLLETMALVCDDVMINLAEAEAKASKGGVAHKLSSWQLRVALGAALAEVLRLDPRLLQSEVLDAAGAHLQGLLDDEAYGARLAGGRLVQVLLEAFPDPASLFSSLKARLTLASTALRQGDNAEQAVETSLSALGETAASCAEAELHAYYLLCGHAAGAPADLPLVAATLDWLAARLGYPHRHAYAAWHQPALAYHWFASPWGLSHWLGLQRLVAPSPEAAAGDPAAFAAACAPVLTAMLVYSPLPQRGGELEALAQMLGTEPGALVRQHFEVLMGYTYPLSQTGAPEDGQRFKAVMTQGTMAALMDRAAVDGLMRSNAVEHIAALLLMARGPCAPRAPAPDRPWFPCDLLVRCAYSLANGASPEDSRRLLWSKVLTHDRLARILLVLHAQLERARCPRHQAQALVPLQATLALLEDRVCEAATFRYTASILLRLLPVGALQEQVCGMLSGAVARVLRLPGAADVAALGALLPALLSVLGEGLQSEHEAGRPLGAPGPRCLLALVQQLTSGAPQQLHPYLRQVDPLPEGIPALAEPAALVAAARQHVTPAEQLGQFAARASSMTPALRHRALGALRKVLAAQQAALFAPAGGDGGLDEAAAGGACLPEVAAAAWRIAVLSSELADAELAEFAGELLALAGPLDPSAIAFDPSAAFSPDAALPAGGGGGAGSAGSSSGPQATPGSQGGRGARGGRARGSPPAGAGRGSGAGAGAAGGTWAAALGLLADYLTDDSVEVIRAAQYTLRHLLATPEGQEALAGLDPSQRPYLEAFRHAAGTGEAGPAAGAAPGGSPTQALDSPRLWRCDRPYGQWVCELAGAMLGQASSATLATCRRMAQRKPAFAELLLPHAFADLATQPSGGALARSLGGAISRHLLPRLHRHPKAARLLLACLNHLRSAWLDAKLAGSGGKAKAGAPAAEIELWRKVYWVDLDYLELAAAAARCGAHFTALLYIEAWREQRRGWLVPLYASEAAAAAGGADSGGGGKRAAAAGGDRGSSSSGGGSGDDSGAAALERLLLDTYSQVNEPDGIYAVARSHSLLAQLKRCEHEGDWSRALLGYDLVLQQLVGGPAGLGGGCGPPAAQHQQQQQQQQQYGGMSQQWDASPPVPFGSQAAWPGASQAAGPAGRPGQHSKAGSEPAFEGISQQAAVAGLLRSLAQLGAGHVLHAYAQAPGVPEAAAEAALSLGHWGQLDGGGGGGGSGFSIDGALSAAVAGLQAGSVERCRQAVAGARRSLVAGLVTASLEGAANVNPALVQLQMLQAVSEAWELLWPALPDLGSVGSPKKRRRPRPPGSAGAEAAAVAAAAAAAGAGPSGGALDGVLQLWRAREVAAGSGGRYSLQAPLQGMHEQLLARLGAPARQADLLVSAAVSARKTDHYAQATTSLYRLRALLQRQAGGAGAGWAQALAAPDACWRVEEAKLLWAQGQRDTAVQLARSLLGAGAARQGGGGGGGGGGALQHAYLRSLTAKWLSRTRSDSPSSVLSLMQEAADEAQGALGEVGGGAAGALGERARACRVLYRLAAYADGLYRNIEAQKASPEYHTAKQVIGAKRRQLEAWAAQLAERQRRGEARVDRKGQLADRESRLLAYHINATRKPVEMDEAEQRLLDERERQFLKTALLNYTRCLLAGDGYDLRVVFRVVQLWLRLAADGEVVGLVGDALRRVPSFKFLPLVYQVASRMSAAKAGPLVESGFQATLAALLVRLGVEHPHHSLYQLFSLKNGNRGKDGKVASGKAIEAFSYAADPDKVAAAEAVLAQVAAASPAARAVVREMSELVDGYIELAAVPPPSKDAEEMAFPSGLRRSRQNYTHLPVTSVELPVDPGGHYEGAFPHFVAFAERIRFVGGINKPKIVTVTDSAGGQHRQLVKSGNDDLRQDAVMQQFFWLVNRLLGEQPRTARRALFIRTYKVVPFSPSAGLLEWVEHTLPLSDYLLGPTRTGGAHARYKRPGDLNWVGCYHELAKVAQGGGQASHAAMRAAFDSVCARFPPAMHHFFLENFRDPGTWFERRLAYTRSMAVNSMAGYVIGLGDRHLQNILLDARTADAVHIDLGIAFEQGRFLNTPELVPFRLTRDVVDGMGVAGVEGVMRRCCEETLRVLRASKGPLLTVIEVFIHDPLYKWALTATAANRRQHDARAADEDDDTGGAAPAGADGGGLANADAERTLLRVKQKLEGVEAGEGEARGVEGQVQQLLADAQDPDKLCRMYIGWQSWV